MEGSIIIPVFSDSYDNSAYLRSLSNQWDYLRREPAIPFMVEEIKVVRRFSHNLNGGGLVAYGGGPRADTGQNLFFLNSGGREVWLDYTFGTNYNDNWVNDLTMNATSEIYAVGSFSGLQGQTDGLAGIVKFDTNGDRINSFTSPFSADSVNITDIELQEDGKLIIAGVYAPEGETNLINGIARLNTDGSFDETFDRSINFSGGTVEKVEIVPGGYIVAGDFTMLNSSESRKGIAKINYDGSLNSEFNGDDTWAGNKIYQVKVVGDAIYVGGDFTEYQSQEVSGLIKLDLDGKLDDSFKLPNTLSALVRDFEVLPGDELEVYMAGKFFDSGLGRKLSAVKLAVGLDGELAGLTVDNVSYDAVQLSWQTSSTNEERFLIERSKNNPENFNFSRVANANTTVYEDNELFETGITYYYRMQAIKGNFKSEYSNIVEVEVPQRPLSPPTNLAVSTFRPSYVIMTWEETNTEEAGFSIERSKNDQHSFTELRSVNANNITFEDGTIEAGTTYYYRVKAFKGDFSSEYSNTIQVIVPPKPVAPSNLTGNIISANQIDLSWTDNSNNEENFRIIKTVNQGPVLSLGHITANQTSYSDFDVEPGQILTYYVVASNGMGSSPPSNILVINTPVITSIEEGVPSQDSRFDFSYDPVSNDLVFKLNVSSDKIRGYQVVSSSGMIKMREEGLRKQEINQSLSGSAPGIYILHVTSDRNKYIVKFIKN